MEIYIVDTETTGLDYNLHEPVEISIMRFSSKEIKTWYLKPINANNISKDALRVNGYAMDDLLGKTEQGRNKFKEPTKVLVEIENWLAEDNLTANERIMGGQNPSFDKEMMYRLWEKCQALDTFPFGRRLLDVSQIAIIMDLAKGGLDNLRSDYRLVSLAKDLGIKVEKAHVAEEDVKTTHQVLIKQLNILNAAFAK